MIKYALQCEQAHGFESWFPDSASFDKQVKRGFVTCPTCNSAKIEKQIMAPRVRNSDERRSLSQKPVQTEVADAKPMALMTEDALKMRTMLRELHAHVVANTEDVGTGFADEARKIHHGDSDDRPIRGKATFDEAKELHSEGIGILPLPPLPEERN